MIEPSKRINAKEALKHCFFHSVVCRLLISLVIYMIYHYPHALLSFFCEQKTQVIKFNARKAFKLAILCVRVLIRIRHYRFTPEVLNMDIIRVEPYKIKILRKVSWLECLTVSRLFFLMSFFCRLLMAAPFESTTTG